MKILGLTVIVHWPTERSQAPPSSIFDFSPFVSHRSPLNAQIHLLFSFPQLKCKEKHPVPLAEEVSKYRTPPKLQAASVTCWNLNSHQATRGQKPLVSSTAAFHCKSTGEASKQEREFSEEMDATPQRLAARGGKNGWQLSGASTRPMPQLLPPSVFPHTRQRCVVRSTGSHG